MAMTRLHDGLGTANGFSPHPTKGGCPALNRFYTIRDLKDLPLLSIRDLLQAVSRL